MSVIYFTDNFFSAGVTEMYNSDKEQVGSLDLRSAFSSSVDVLDLNGSVTMSGAFKFFSRKWFITNGAEQEIGELLQRFSFFAKKFEYEAYGRGTYRIESEAFSKDYEIYDQGDNLIAEFRKTSGFFASPAFSLTNHSEELSDEELVAVVMGVSMIHKRNSNSANSGANM